MARPEKPGKGEIDPAPGIAGGPGPTPPGVEDGTVRPRHAQPESQEWTRLPADGQKEVGEKAERTAGVRRADVPAYADEHEGRGAEGHPNIQNYGAEQRTRR